MKINARLKKTERRLTDSYGTPMRESKKIGSVLDELVLTILSQNTNDKNSFQAFKDLKATFPTWTDVLNSETSHLAEVIKIGGLGPSKAVYIQNALNWLMEERGELDCEFICDIELDKAINMLTSIKGIGVKTVAVTLAFACGADLFPVDTHVFRVCKRLGTLPAIKTPEKAYYFLQDKIPAGSGFPFHMNIIRHGREICHARKPACQECVLTDLCEYFSNNESNKN